jgi:hypothetical protein
MVAEGGVAVWVGPADLFAVRRAGLNLGAVFEDADVGGSKVVGKVMSAA